MAFDVNRLLTVLNNTGLQTKDNSLYQLLKQLIEGISSLNGEVASINNSIATITENITQAISQVVQLSLDSSSSSGNDSLSGIVIPGPTGKDAVSPSPGYMMAFGEGSSSSDVVIPGPKGADGINTINNVAIPGQDGSDGESSMIPGPQGLAGFINQLLSGLIFDHSGEEPNVIPFYLNVADLAQLNKSNAFRISLPDVFFRVQSAGEAQLTIASDSESASPDTDGFFRVVIDGNPGTLKAFFGYDQGNDRALVGYNGAGAFVINNANALGMLNKAYLYNNIALEGWGLPTIYKYNRLTGQTAAVASVTSYTVGAADGSFEISWNVKVTAVTSCSFSVRVSYTDENGVSRSPQMFGTVEGTATTVRTIVNGLGAVPYTGFTHRIRAQAGTTITVITSGFFTDVTYNVEADIKQVA